MAEWDESRPWYHGSQERLTVLRRGSSITQDPAVACAFSHRPSLVSQTENGKVQHDGTLPGYLYVIAEEVRPGDASPHPHPVNAHRWEWLTTREVRVTLLERTQTHEAERLSEADIAELRQKQATTGKQSFLEETSTPA